MRFSMRKFILIFPSLWFKLYGTVPKLGGKRDKDLPFYPRKHLSKEAIWDCTSQL